jgi:hypothetical protein
VFDVIACLAAMSTSRGTFLFRMMLLCTGAKSLFLRFFNHIVSLVLHCTRPWLQETIFAVPGRILPDIKGFPTVLEYMKGYS